MSACEPSYPPLPPAVAADPSTRWPPPAIPVQKPRKRPRSNVPSPGSLAAPQRPSPGAIGRLVTVQDMTGQQADFRSSPSPAIMRTIPLVDSTPVVPDFDFNGMVSVVDSHPPIVESTAFEPNLEMSFPLAQSISDLLDLGGGTAGNTARSDGEGHFQDPNPEFDALMNEFLDMWGGSSNTGGANKDPRRPVDTFDQALWAQVHPSEAPAGNPISLKMCKRLTLLVVQ